MELFPFQQVSVDLFENEFSTLNGDDMGLGKTVQAVALDKRRRELHKATFVQKYKGKAMTLVIAPLGVLDGWQHHFTLWNPELRVFRIDPKKRQPFEDAVAKGAADVYLVHWDGLRLLESLRKVMWFHVIADEIHRIKNPKSQMHINFQKIQTYFKYGLSGTMADNKPEDFWAPLNWAFPKTFPSYWSYVRHYVIVKSHNAGMCMALDCFKDHKRAFRETVGTAHEDELHAKFAGKFIRRLKKDVLKELPEKYYTHVEVDLTPQQRVAYNQMRLNMLAWVGKNEDQPIQAPMVLAQLIRLQQFANAYGKIERVRTRKRIEDLTDPRGFTYEEFEQDKLVLTDPSSKLDWLVEKIGDNPDESFVVFTQSKDMARLLSERLHRENITYGLYTGDTTATRDQLVHDFQAGEVRVFIGTIKAGGEGITLTRASTVVFIDRAWNPSQNRQAEDRLHRIGQRNAVQVIILIARDTIDPERVGQIELKWSWLRKILGDKDA